MYLLDTNVIFELRKLRPHGAVVVWIQSVPRHQVFMSAVTLGELQAGVELTKRQNLDKAFEIERWIDSISEVYQVLPMDAPVFREWARLMDRRPGQMLQDAMTAATARVHRMIVVTKNVRDFASFGVEVLNPFLSER
jgi:predicted nucleic acid-binding protein